MKTPHSSPPQRAPQGFTLVEMMVTVALMAIMLAIAVPSFTSFRRNSELVSITNGFVAALNAARTEAMKRNMYAMVTPVNNDNDWTAGWVAFVDVDGDNKFGAGDIEVFRQPAIPSYLTFTGNNSLGATNSHARYDGSGFSRPVGDLLNATLSVTRTDANGDSRQIRRIKIALTGRVRVCTPTSGSDTTCAGTGD